MGEPAFLSEEVQKCFLKKMDLDKSICWMHECNFFFFRQFQGNPEPDLEVVTCSGYGKNGALSVLQVNHSYFSLGVVFVFVHGCCHRTNYGPVVVRAICRRSQYSAISWLGLPGLLQRSSKWPIKYSDTFACETNYFLWTTSCKVALFFSGKYFDFFYFICSQRSIRPQVVTTFELPGCHDMWTVISNEVKEDKKVKRK